MTENRFSRNVFPASLLCEERKCLVVGGGKVAAHKTGLLLDAGAHVTVVSPELNEAFAELLRAGKITHISRPFEPSDVHGTFVVFAATNMKPVNRNVMDACNAQNVLCCRVDGDWFESDFVTPAILREKEFILSVSTGGGSCKRSRRLKENLRHHVQFLRQADLLVIGLDHNTATVTELESAKQKIAETCEMFACLWGVHEFMTLSTCNRLELIGIVSDHDKTIELLLKLLGLEKNGYVKRGRDAFVHLAEVAAGLHAQTLGEKNIVAQLKHTLNEALSNSWCNGGVQSWMDTALHISKQIRQEIEPFIESMEIEDVCNLYLQELYPESDNTLIIGRGTIGTGVLERRPDARQISGRDAAEIQAELPKADIVIVTTGSDTYLLTEEYRPLLKKGAVLIDLSMPRNIDPALPGIIGLADLKHWCRPDNLAHVIEISRPIILEHAGEYDRLVNI
ncbi:NAD(P)-dependent oxidoreductase [Verrucomicrobiota bacterium]